MEIEISTKKNPSSSPFNLSGRATNKYLLLETSMYKQIEIVVLKGGGRSVPHLSQSNDKRGRNNRGNIAVQEKLYIHTFACCLMLLFMLNKSHIDVKPERAILRSQV